MSENPLTGLVTNVQRFSIKGKYASLGLDYGADCLQAPTAEALEALEMLAATARTAGRDKSQGGLACRRWRGATAT